MSLGLLGSYLSSSEDESSEKEEEVPIKEEKPEGPKPVLSNPFGSSVSGYRPSYLLEVEDMTTKKLTNSEHSVFSNPFRAKEEHEKAMLERHVEMTNRPEDMTRSIEGKKICWNYRKGRCRFGSKCTFAHDSDLRSNQTQPAVLSSGPEIHSNGEIASVISSQNSQGVNFKKKRPGLGDSLTPSKKAMKFFDKIYDN